MTQTSVILEDVLNDTLLLGSLAASIFVKNPMHQNQAGNLINAAARLIQVIDAQIEAAKPQPVQNNQPVQANPVPVPQISGAVSTVKLN